jgi:polysaccharide biosynthesis protein PslG
VLRSGPRRSPSPALPDLRPLKTTLTLLLVAAALIAPAAAQAVPRTFFGIGPQTGLTETDVSYMKAGGIGTVRWPVGWPAVQPTANGAYDWSSVDPAVEMAARGGLTVLPFLYGTPRWLANKPTTLPIDSGRARKAWVAFVKAAVARYGPHGEFWKLHSPAVAGVNGLSEIAHPKPIRTWQVWNEANFFYFAYPVSPSRYASLLKLSHGAIRSVDPGAKVLLSGLFGNPDEGGKKGMDAIEFLEALYRVPGIKADFDAVALHPYAFHVDVLEELTEGIREVVLENRDPSAGLYITEMGWGSQNDPDVVAFEQGMQGQARELRKAYRYLIANRSQLNLKSTYWFSWKDIQGDCNFCDSVGLFREGAGFKPKPAWKAFVALTGGRARP